MERDNRKSHLAPQLSPATQELLRSTDSPRDATYHGDGRELQTPTSGEIPIVGALVSPRDQRGSASNRSPTRPGGIGVGRPGGQAVHPGLGRVATTSSIPRVTATAGGQPAPSEYGGPSSASRATFSLPVRPGPPGGPLPPPPPLKETPEELRRENRRQATFGPPSNGGYGSGYPTN